MALPPGTRAIELKNQDILSVKTDWKSVDFFNRSDPNFYAPVFSISTNVLRQHSIKMNPTWFLSKQNAFY